jgi:hypothetical protein
VLSPTSLNSFSFLVFDLLLSIFLLFSYSFYNVCALEKFYFDELLSGYVSFTVINRLVGFIVLVIYKSLIDAGSLSRNYPFPGRAQGQLFAERN